MVSRCQGRCLTLACMRFITRKELLSRGSGPYFYLPKMESHLEARALERCVYQAEGSWDSCGARSRHGADRTILASFEMDEILWELKTTPAG